MKTLDLFWSCLPRNQGQIAAPLYAQAHGGPEGPEGPGEWIKAYVDSSDQSWTVSVRARRGARWHEVASGKGNDMPSAMEALEMRALWLHRG